MTTRHPPADRRCQIYIGDQNLARCVKEGTAWQKWGGCNCSDAQEAFCEADFWSWECDGNHAIEVTV